ncbi:hypothetical protein FGRA07_10453 [Fusarium graminearum]|nr:hypothetical protein FGRA07_10453 [Fusarium graminearum]
MPPLTHDCGIDAEPLYRYEPGGYHPAELGDILKDGRYKVLHKLGWSSFSTTWAAKDQENNSYVAVKVKVSEAKDTRELDVLQAISALPKHHPGSSHANQMLDHFTLGGPNGSHECLVLELVGPSVSDAIEFYCNIHRLPAKVAKSFAKQALRGLDFLVANDIAHGAVPDLKSLNVEDFMAALGKLQAGPVTKKGGQPAFEVLPKNHAQLGQQMIEETGDEFPSRWQAKWNAMQKYVSHDDERFTLQEWMEATYFFHDGKDEFTKEELAKICETIICMLKFEPSLRATPSEILAQGLF